MWATIERTRRRLLHFGAPTEPPGHAAAPERDDATLGPTMLTLARPDLDRLGQALQALLGPDIARPDTPDRLEAALAAAVLHLGGVGEPRVNRRPAGLYTPEAWQVHIERADPAVVDAIRRAIREGVFAA
jgi:hypothetical protein